MVKILIIGAGRSSTVLIDYLINLASKHNWFITVADMDLALATSKVANRKSAEAIEFNIKNEEKRREILKEHDFVISMLPAFMHGDVARECVEFGKHLATASYVSNEIRALDNEAKSKNLILLNECGLDPGIDHASAMKIIEEIKSKGGEITSFKSYCGGLVAPESNNNPWGYKFSWNPRNVVLAGQGTAQLLQNGELKFVAYNRLFKNTETIEVDGFGKFDAYPNRDSVGYKSIYGLDYVKTMIRGTLRQYGYCKAWDVFVALGLTDDTSKINDADKYTYTDLVNAFLPHSNKTVLEKLKELMKGSWDNEIEKMLEYLELFSHKKITLKEGTPAQLLQSLLEEKWKLNSNDKDLVVMQHLFEFKLPKDERMYQLNSSLAVVGKNSSETAMAITVGLPLAITVKNFLEKKFSFSGVQIPISKEIYEPLLAELEVHNIKFHDKTKII